MRFLITGGAGFIGSALVGNRESLRAVAGRPGYEFLQADICDRAALDAAFAAFQPDAVLHLAAESHVDRSIDGPAAFIQTNVVGTYTLLEAARAYWSAQPPARRAAFRFLHISTDEVFGSLGADGLFREDTPYAPNSPYSASKAGSDHLVRAWHHTYGLPVVMSNCSNNYGPWQFPEKLIPLTILKALAREELPVYGKGENVRDWLFVDDHVSALMAILTRGKVGESYNVGGNAERRNIDVVKTICAMVDEMVADGGPPREEKIRFVTDRPGHDLRYAIDASRITRELGWTQTESFDSGLRRTVEWYLANKPAVSVAGYAGERLGALVAGTR